MSLADNVLRAEGGVVLESGGLLLRADLLEYDRGQQEGSAAGNLLFVDGNIVLLAEEGVFSLDGDKRLTIHNATLLQKGKAQPPGSFASLSSSAARKAGANDLVLRAEQIERIARSRFVAKRLEMTSCDCGEDCTPDWSMSASSADVEVGERAILYWPTFRVKGMPVLVLPAMYLPLSDRRSGLLLPQLSFRNGFAIDQPLFLTLGESYDLTLTLGARLGRDSVDGKRAQMLGPRGSAEFRYAPHDNTTGRLLVAAMNDRHRELPADRPPRGWRGELSWRHATDTKSGVGLRADGRLVSDAYYVVDESTDVLRASAIPYVRSQASGFWRGESAVLSLSTAWYQDRGAPWTDGTARFAPERRFFGPDAPISFQRPISLRLEVPQLRLFGPVRGGVDVAASHYRPIAPGGEMSILRLQQSMPGGFVPLTMSRLDVRPSLAVTLIGRGPVRVEGYAAARADLSAYAPVLGEGPRHTDLWGRAIAGLWAGTEVSRIYGEGDGALRHSIAPRLELRASTPEYGERSAFSGYLAPVDEYDFYQRAADPSLLQGIASVTTRLSRRKGGDLLRLELGQGVDFGSGALGDSFGRLDLGTRFVTVGAGARYDGELSEFAQVGARLTVRDGRGDSIVLGYDRLSANGTDRMRAGLDDLFGPAARDPNAGSFDEISLGTTVVPLKGTTLRYGIRLRPTAEQKVLQHIGAVGLSTGCDCWRLDLWGAYTPGHAPTFGVLLDLKNFGSFGN